MDRYPVESFNPQRTATLKLSEWFVILDALEEWGYRDEISEAEAARVRGRIPTDAVEAWLRNKDTSPPLQ